MDVYDIAADIGKVCNYFFFRFKINLYYYYKIWITLKEEWKKYFLFLGVWEYYRWGGGGKGD